MDNHYHLLIETPDSNLSKGMRHLNGVYSLRFNRIHNRVGHVFQGRYKAIFIDKENHLKEVARYIVLNPVRAHMVAFAGEWRWSSYLTMVGSVKPPRWLNTGWLLSCFCNERKAAIEQYQRFVEKGLGHTIWQNISQNIYLGGNQFVEIMQSKINQENDLSEVPMGQRRVAPKTLELYARGRQRDEAIILAYASGGYSMKEVGAYFGLHYSRVSRILKKAKGKT